MKPRMVELTDPAERREFIEREGDLGVPMLVRDADGTLRVDADDLRAFRKNRSSNQSEGEPNG